MKSLSFFLFGLILSAPILAKDLSIVIEHPRKNNRMLIRNEINCSEQCNWKSEQKKVLKGTTTNKEFAKNIEGLLELIQKDQIPASKKLSLRETFVNVTISDGKKTETFQLGHARSYQGDDLKKFSLVNSYLTKIEFNLQREKVKK